MGTKIKRILYGGTRIALSLSLVSLLLVSLGSTTPCAEASPALVVARTQTGEVITKGSNLASGVSSRAADLLILPPAWDWTEPAKSRKLSQAVGQLDDAAATESSILDEVTVTATRRPTRERDTTAATYVVDRRDIKASGAVTVTDSLVLVPGLQFAPALGGVRNFGNNYMRGFNDQRFFVLRDGLLNNRPDNNSSDISRFSVQDLERVEVLSGGSVLRYGAGAVGGVINIVTETPKGPPKFTLGYEAGSYGFSRYLAKYGGGDDAFSYNLSYSGIVAFNDYPYAFTLPNQAQFYGPTDFTPGGIPLFGLLKPEVGPPISVSGRADQSYAASDTYALKLAYKPDPYNSLVFKFNQQNSKNAFVSPGSTIYPYGVCRGGQPGFRILPVDRNGVELPCNTQRYLPNTATTAFIASRFLYNTSADGRIVFPTGQSYPSAEGSTASVAFNEQSTQSESQTTVFWNHDPSPGISFKSYINYSRFTQPVYQPPYFFNTNVLAPFFGLSPAGQAAQLPVVAPIPYAEGSRWEMQSLLDAHVSPGQVLSFGVNFQEDRSFTRFDTGGFSDRSLSRTAFFLIDDINFGPELQANIGLRHTISNQAGSYLVPAAGLRYSPTKAVSFRANWSQVVNLPPIDELYTFASGAPFASNPSLKPETGVTYDVGLDVIPTPNLGLRLTYFNTYIDNYRVAVAEPNPDPLSAFPLIFRSQNVGSRYASGIEFELDYRFAEYWRLRGAWTNTDSRPYGFLADQTSSLYPFYFGYQDPGIPFNSVVASLSYENRGFLVSLLGRFDGGKRRGFAGGSIPQGGEQFVPAWAAVDLYFEVPLTPIFTVTGAVQNLTDSQYEYLSGVPAPGTTFRLGARLEFGG